MITQLFILAAAAALADPMALYDQALAARQQGDAQRFLQATEKLAEWAPTNPPLRFLRAEALAMSGRTAPALADLRWLADHGYHYAFWERTSFASLAAGAATTALRAATIRNGEPSGKIARLIRADIELSGEGIDAFEGGWIAGSMTTGHLHRIETSGATSVLWRETEPSRRMLGVRNDAGRKIVWACSTGPNEREPHSQLLRISLQQGSVQRFRFPDARSLCNDIALLPDGAVAVSDSERGAVLQLTLNGQWRTLVEPGTFGYPNGLTWLAADQRLVVADLRGLWTIDPETACIAAVEAPEGTFVGSIDGLYAVDGGLLGIQNGLQPHRVVRIVLADAARRVARVEIVASNLPELAEMTTAAVGRGEITVLASSQLVQLVSSDSADD
jgi:hypothetical protein